MKAKWRLWFYNNEREKHALRLHYTLSTGFATRARTDIAKNIKLKSLVINKNK